MIRLGMRKGEGEKPVVLCLGAHCDDIEIGCGAAVQRFCKENHGVSVAWVVFCSNETRAKEAEGSANWFLREASHKRVRTLDFRDGFLPYQGEQVKSYFEALKNEVSPDIIFTHFRNDLHQDHRLVSELTWNTFRDHLVLEYEIPKYDGDLGQPNLFMPIEEAAAKEKAAKIVESFASQLGKPWFTQSTFLALMRLRGIECNAGSGYAEAFYARKVSW